MVRWKLAAVLLALAIPALAASPGGVSVTATGWF